jgi:hypothetical protein
MQKKDGFDRVERNCSPVNEPPEGHTEEVGRDLQETA